MTSNSDFSNTLARPALPARSRALDPSVKLAIELGPLACFFAASYRYNLHVATGVLMVGVVVALVLSYALTRRLPVMPVVTAIAVLLFGALTFYFDNPIFIKMKPTVVNCIFGAALLGGLAFGKPLLPIVLDSALRLDEAGWRKLTFRWGLFFFVLAALNEFVWRTQSDVFWAGFKVFGTMPLTILFALSQVPLIMRHEDKSEGLRRLISERDPGREDRSERERTSQPRHGLSIIDRASQNGTGDVRRQGRIEVPVRK